MTAFTRLKCSKCGAILEITLKDHLVIDGKFLRCPSCGHTVFEAMEMRKEP